MKTSIPRIRSVTDKTTGRQVRVLRHRTTNDRASIDGRIRELMDRFFADPTTFGAGGFAFVIWDKEGGSMTALSAFSGSTVHRASMPDFVRGCIANNIAKNW